ncbi:hypothetical protein BH20VER1_BH20VER1_11880 [soil metagenome]
MVLAHADEKRVSGDGGFKLFPVQVESFLYKSADAYPLARAEMFSAPAIFLAQVNPRAQRQSHGGSAAADGVEVSLGKFRQARRDAVWRSFTISS